MFVKIKKTKTGTFLTYDEDNKCFFLMYPILRGF